MPTISRNNRPLPDGRLLCMFCGEEIDPERRRQRNGQWRDFCSDRCRAGWRAAAIRVLEQAGLLGGTKDG